MKRIIMLFASLAIVAAAFPQGLPAIPDLSSDFREDSLTLEVGARAAYDSTFYTVEAGGLTYFSPHFAMLALLQLNGDGKYAPGLNIGDNYFLVDAGGVAAQFGDFSVRAGQLPAGDVVDSPYSLFANGSGRTSTIGEIRFSRGAFSYESRWIGLNHNTVTADTAVYPSGYFPERGANLKTYALSLGAITFGLQDAAVYAGRYFDFDYFVDPMPSYFVQYINGRSGRPWYNGIEDNALLGAFMTWNVTEDFDTYAQLLMDDFSALGLLGEWSNNPWKVAWSLGGTWKTDAGTFGFYHAGATKYCFEPTYETAGYEYAYAYYPDTVYKNGGSTVAIPFEDMMLGYQHGENNLAAMGTWSQSLAGFDLGASLEFTLSGSKSPANAWHEATWTDYTGTKLLDESKLEKKILLTAGASRRFGAFGVFVQGRAGYVINELQATTSVTPVVVDGNAATPYSSIEIWKPSDTNRLLYSFTVGGSVSLGL